MLYIKPSTWHTIHAEHIEPATRPFYVRWDSDRAPTAEPGIMWEAGKRHAKVMAQTPGGALDIARYHYSRFGSNFELLLKHEWPKE